MPVCGWKKEGGREERKGGRKEWKDGRREGERDGGRESLKGK